LWRGYRVIAFLLAHWVTALSLLGGGGGLGVLSFLFPSQALVAVRTLWAWLCHRSFWQLTTLGLGAYCGLQLFELRHAHAEAAKWEKQFHSEHAGRLADRASYVKAQADAAAQNKAQVQRVEQQQQKVTDNVEAQYRADLARLHAEQLRQQPNAASPGVAGRPGSPAPGTASSGPDGQAVPLPGPDLLRAQETELQLNALIDWELQQEAIDPNKP
jgi:hypothetical protein